MRCPKCGYITFDHLETCTKCRKKIGAVSEQLSGTIFKADAPAFLQLKVNGPDAGDTTADDVLQEDNDLDVEFTLDGEDEGQDNGLTDGDIEFDFLDEGTDSPASKGHESTEEEDFDLDLFDDEESVELSLEEDGEQEAEDKDGLQLDFSELDISDLAPPAADDDHADAELTLEDVSAGSTAKPEVSRSSPMGSGANLEDLQMDGLDLDMPSLPPAGSVTGKSLRPAVKTGTALDGFDIDLGELVSGKEK